MEPIKFLHLDTELQTGVIAAHIPLLVTLQPALAKRVLEEVRDVFVKCNPVVEFYGSGGEIAGVAVAEQDVAAMQADIQKVIAKIKNS